MQPTFPNISVSPQAKALIFDCDGTLADTMPLHYAAWHEAFAAFGAKCPQSFLEDLTGIPTTIIIARFNERFGYDLNIVAVAQEKSARMSTKIGQAKPIEPVVRIARQYCGRLPMAVATGGRRANIDKILQAIGLGDFFPVIVSADDAVQPKPAPDIFLEAARQLNVEPRYCQVFEDANSGVEGASRAGMIVTDVRNYGISLTTDD